MKRWLHKLEHVVDKSIPFMLLVLLVIIIMEFFFHDAADKYHHYIEIADVIIITTFVIDLSFKYHRVRNVPRFLKKYWLDVIAVFPFFIFFRLFEEIAKLIGEAKDFPLTAQKVVHAGLEIKEARLASEAARLGREAEGAAQLTRTERFARFIRPISRSPRMVKSIPFYEDPKHRAELKKEVKSIEHEFEILEKKGAKVFKEVKADLVHERRRSHPSKNKGKRVQGKVRSVKRKGRARAKARKRL